MDKVSKKLVKKSIILAFCIFVIDQISKLTIRKLVGLNSNIPVINNIFDIVNIRNRGIAFGMLENFSVNQYKLFLLLTLVAIGILFYFYIAFIRSEDHHFFIVYALAVIIGGALGNFFDRLVFGYVTDFIHLYYKTFQWPAFNFADSCISVGAVSLIIFLIFHPNEMEERKANGEETDAQNTIRTR